MLQPACNTMLMDKAATVASEPTGFLGVLHAVGQCLESLTSESDGRDNLCVCYVSADRGYGTFGTRRIWEGEQIFVEKPLLTVDQTEFSFPTGMDKDEVDRRAKSMLASSISNELDRLDESLRDQFYQLSTAPNHMSEPKALGIFLTNAMRTSTSGTSAVFKLVSRINHSCMPNVIHRWNEVHQELTLHAACDIEPGTELSIAYNIGRGLTREARQAKLRLSFGFLCDCDLCSPKEFG